MDAREKKIRAILRANFESYAEACLKIRVKSARKDRGKILPFLFNRAQRYVNRRLDEQKARQGKVRALLLKGRQQGCSTLVGGRFYHITTHNKGIKTFILTHREDATNTLFAMVKRYHDHCPEFVRPHTSYSNRKEIVFDLLDSAYSLGTAGAGDVGRSDTIDLFHGSEAAFWKNTDELKTGIIQAAEAAQEIIFESTANGLGNMFHQMWQDAEAGLGEYEAIFVPWYWQDEYTTKCPDNTVWDNGEIEYQFLYGLSDDQMFWRRNKIIFLKDPLLFKQEYPATASEAFQTTGTDSFIKPEVVIRARKAKGRKGRGAHIVGLDPARGGDRTSFAHRRGHEIFGVESVSTPDTMLIIGMVVEMMEDESEDGFVDRLFMDIGGLGGPLWDFLKDMPFAHRITVVNFGDTSVFRPDRYVNKRAEMLGMFKDWLSEAEQALIPDSDALQADICAPGYSLDSRQRILMESKKAMRTRGIRSTDELDACGLTFAMPVLPMRGNGVNVRAHIPFAC